MMTRAMLIAAPPPLFEFPQRSNKEIIQRWNASTCIKGAEIEVHKYQIKQAPCFPWTD